MKSGPGSPLRAKNQISKKEEKKWSPIKTESMWRHYYQILLRFRMLSDEKKSLKYGRRLGGMETSKSRRI